MKLVIIQLRSGATSDVVTSQHFSQTFGGHSPMKPSTDTSNWPPHSAVPLLTWWLLIVAGGSWIWGRLNDALDYFLQPQTVLLVFLAHEHHDSSRSSVVSLGHIVDEDEQLGEHTPAEPDQTWQWYITNGKVKPLCLSGTLLWASYLSGSMGAGAKDCGSTQTARPHKHHWLYTAGLKHDSSVHPLCIIWVQKYPIWYFWKLFS